MIDHDHLKRQTGGDAALQEELLLLFAAQLDDLAAQLPTLGERPRDAAQILLHRIRGAALGIGAFGLAEPLGEAEALLEESVLPPRAVTALLASVNAVREETKVFIAAAKARSLAKAGESR